MKKIIVVLLALLCLCACSSAEQADDSSNTDDVKVLTMATEATFEPYEYYDGEEIVGIDVEIAEKICEKLGYELEVVDTSFSSLVSGVQEHKYDFSMAGMTVSEERLEKINFTNSYATGIQVIIVNSDSDIKSVDDLYNGTYLIGVQSGTTGEIYSLDDFGEDNVKSFDKTTDAATALVNKQIDCIILDNEPAKAIVAKNEGLMILDTEYSVEDYAIAIAKDNDELLNEFNTALEELTNDGTIQTIIDKYIGE